MKRQRKMRMTKISAAVFGTVILGFWLFLLFVEIGRGPVSPMFLVTLVPLAAILGLMVFFVRMQSQAVKSGMPLKDERTERIENRAGKYAAMGTAWFLLAMGLYQMLMEEINLPDIPVRYFIWIVFFVLLGLFAGFRLWFGRRGSA